MRKKEQTEERWLTSLKKALVKHGVTVDAIAGAVKRAMEAERMTFTQDGEAVSLGPHHAVQLKGASLAIELYRPQSARQLDAGRPILNVQAGAKVQLVFFGEARDALPEAGTVVPSLPTPMSAELRATLVRQGKIPPDGTVPETAKAESPKALPEPKRGDGWLLGR